MSFESEPRYPCILCSKAAKGVTQSRMVPSESFAFCDTCLGANRTELWTTLVAGLFGSRKEDVVPWVKDSIKAVCEFYNRTEDQLWKDVKLSENKYARLVRMKGLRNQGI